MVNGDFVNSYLRSYLLTTSISDSIAWHKSCLRLKFYKIDNGPTELTELPQP